MILSFVIISYESGGVLFARHYGASLATESAQATWMRRLHAATAADWGLLRSEGEEQVATLGGAEAAVQVLYKLLGDVVLLLAGDEEHLGADPREHEARDGPVREPDRRRRHHRQVIGAVHALVRRVDGAPVRHRRLDHRAGQVAERAGLLRARRLDRERLGHQLVEVLLVHTNPPGLYAFSAA